MFLVLDLVTVCEIPSSLGLVGGETDILDYHQFKLLGNCKQVTALISPLCSMLQLTKELIHISYIPKCRPYSFLEVNTE